MNDFQQKLYEFMRGRYGNDELNRCLSVTAFILCLVSLIPHCRFCYIPALILIGLSIYRMLSRKLDQRYKERNRYLKITDKPRKWIRVRIRRFKERKTYDYYKCPKCRTFNRIPKGHGRIEIRCPKCANTYIRGKKRK